MFNRFDLDNNYKPVKTNKNKQDIDNSKIKILLALSVLVITILVFLGVRNLLNKNSSIKLDKSKDIVYTLYTSKKGSQTVPYLNVKNEDLQLINDNISKYVKPYLNNEKVIIDYDYSLNGIILSLVIKINDTENYKIKFRSYNLNIKEERLLSDDYLLDYYSVDSSYIKEKVKSKLHEYYKKESGEYFASQEIDFDDYLYLRSFDTIDTKDYAYFIIDGQLTAFVPFNPYSIYDEEEFFTDEHFNFAIADAPTE